MTDITIRRARPADEATLSALIAAAYARLDPALYAPGTLEAALPAMSRANPRLLASGTYHLVEVDGVPAACGGWSHEAPGGGAREPGLAHIRHFATHPDHLRKGLARRLLVHCLAEAKEAGAVRMRAWATQDAVAFYERAGFRRLRTLDVAMGPSVSLRSVEMERPI